MPDPYAVRHHDVARRAVAANGPPAVGLTMLAAAERSGHRRSATDLPVCSQQEPHAYLALVARDDRGRSAVHDAWRQAERPYAAHRPGALAATRRRRGMARHPAVVRKRSEAYKRCCKGRQVLKRLLGRLVLNWALAK